MWARPTWLAALAASLSYLSLAATSFRGFSEFGLIGGVGMLACWFATFLILPACIGCFDRKRRFVAARNRKALFSLPGWLTALGAEHPRAVLVGAVVGSALGLLVPALHDTPVQLQLSTQGAGLAISLPLPR